MSGGFGVIRLSITDAASIAQGTNIAGFDIGGGAIGFFSKHTGIRFDLRYYRHLGAASEEFLATGKPQVSFMTLSVGVVIRR